MLTVAKACDDKVECASGEDERWICTNPILVFLGVIGCFVLVLCFVIAIKFCKKKRKEMARKNDLIELRGMVSLDDTTNIAWGYETILDKW